VSSVSTKFLKPIFAPENWFRVATNVVIVVEFVVVIRFSKYYNSFISQTIVVILRTYTGDNILHNRTVSDFQAKS